MVRRLNSSGWLLGGFVGVMLIPNLLLAYTEPLPLGVRLISLLLPLALLLGMCALFRRSGVVVWLSLPWLLLGAFQIVLHDLFGGSVISTNMFTNLLTTNPTEAGELLANLWPVVVLICLVDLPLLAWAAWEIRQRRTLTKPLRCRVALLGLGTLLVALLLVGASDTSRRGVDLLHAIFPCNALYNLHLALEEQRRIEAFDTTSAHFRYDAVRTSCPAEREVYLYVIGEASRAMSWQLFGYERPTNPRLAMREELCLFENLLTQSNTTHRSVPMMLSSVPPTHHNLLYHRPGVAALFREAGFETWFLSTQQPQGAMIDRLAASADHCHYLPEGCCDGELLGLLEPILAQSESHRLLIILHTYGSHFSYRERYPRSFARFRPDDAVAIRPENRASLQNAYDNSLLYTDCFLSETIRCLESLEGCCAALLYCADHGEDLFDDRRKCFLHSSPTATCYQLHVASFVWFSPRYRERFPMKVAAAHTNRRAPATTYSLFHTLADVASISSPYVDPEASLVSPRFDSLRPRYYLNDHNRASSFRHIGLQEEDYAYFRRRNIVL